MNAIMYSNLYSLYNTSLDLSRPRLHSSRMLPKVYSSPQVPSGEMKTLPRELCPPTARWALMNAASIYAECGVLPQRIEGEQMKRLLLAMLGLLVNHQPVLRASELEVSGQLEPYLFRFYRQLFVLRSTR